MRGRRPKPSWLKAVCGNPGKRPLNAAEPAPIGDLEEGDAPEWLTPEQRLLWRRVILDAPPGLLRKLDQTLLATYVVASDMQAQAVAGLAKYGCIVKNPDGDPIKSPWNTILRGATMTLLRTAAELGFSPSSRSRVTLVADKKKNNVFADMKAFADLKAIADE